MVRVGINGFGRIGRLVFRLLNEIENVDIVAINEAVGDAKMTAYLANYDSVHGRWSHKLNVLNNETLIIDQDQSKPIQFTSVSSIEQGPWKNVDIVLECTGAFKKTEELEMYLKLGVQRVLVACPVKGENVLNVVVGCNENLITKEYPFVTAASCTTNCIAPVIKVIHENFGIRHGTITTIHDLTNTQSVVDAPNAKKSDPRRARSALMNLAPTSTGSATAIGKIFPELDGLLNGLAVRVPLTNASLTDLVLEVKKETTAEQVNQLLRDAASMELIDILGVEDEMLVSTDFKGDPRSSIVDAPSTMVINKTMIKIFSWYDNEYGYANRMIDILKILIQQFEF